LNRKVAKYAKLKTRGISIVQNRVTVLDKAAFKFADSPANLKNLGPLYKYGEKIPKLKRFYTDLCADSPFL
jgi:DNA-directed RNA polymerase delta subunit